MTESRFDATVHDLLWRLVPDSIYRRLRTWRPVRVQGRTFRIPETAGLHVPAASLDQRWRRELIGNMVPDREGHFIDVGARLGEVLVDQQSAVPTLRYVGFEPDPARAQYVSDLIRMNSLSSAQVLPTALTEGAAFDEIRATVAPGRVRLVNIRVGGAEAEVLWGMRATLRTDRPVLLGEVRFAVAEQDRAAERERKQAMEEVLREYCYVILQLVINGQGDIVGGARVREFPLAVESPANRLQRDYLMLPLEELDRLKRHLY